MRTGPLAAARLPLIGLGFLVILAALVTAAIVDYSGGFQRRVEVTLVVPDAGNQLGLGAQVKLHGAVVGTVEAIDTDGDGAVLTLWLDPDRVDLIPANTVARILPKTLVGQDYVDLVVAEQPSTARIAAGDTIARDTSASAVVLESALDSLLDVLEALPPQQVSSTLNAVATALEGRGATLGTTLTTLGDYLGELNPSIPTLADDFRGLARLSETYEAAAPDLLAAFDDLTTTAGTLSEREGELDTLLTRFRRTGDELELFLDANAQNLVDVAADNRSTLATLATYAPQFPCLLDQLAGLVPRVDEIFGKGEERPSLRITLRVTQSRGKYLPNQDEPEYADTRGPRCYEIVRIAPQDPEGGPLRDGTQPSSGPATARGGTTR
jgi:phospholipid/cholesterol/gamma-HCH transport system substrate-binding protein